jgi:hypothetical protein
MCEALRIIEQGVKKPGFMVHLLGTGFPISTQAKS